jgi:hypothetical protein
MESFGSPLNQSRKQVIGSEKHRVENLTTQELTGLPKQERDRLISESAETIISELRATNAIEYTNYNRFS